MAGEADLDREPLLERGVPLLDLTALPLLDRSREPLLDLAGVPPLDVGEPLFERFVRGVLLLDLALLLDICDRERECLERCDFAGLGEC